MADRMLYLAFSFKVGTAISLNMTHNASFCAESVNAAAWNRPSEVG